MWLDEFGYLPPDFSSLPALPYPQDLLTVTREGKSHEVTREDWPQRRQELKQLVEEHLLGHAPPAPGNVRAIVEEKTGEGGRETWTVRLEFGPDHAARLHCWLWIPANLQKKPAPVFLVDNTNYTQFARQAFDHGQFLICIYNATDPAYRADKKDESETYKDLFGKFDWSEFRRRGWSASRALDWLTTLDFVDSKQIYIGGHSRSAKQALACAAFDERVAGMIASSPGAGGSLQFRYCDQYYYDESAERLTTAFPLWVSPKVRFFAGRENKLPADMHYVYALLAPRPVLMSTAIHDSVESTWAVEQMYASILPVWEMLGKPGNLALRYRLGPHRPDAATFVAHSDFLVSCVEGKAPVDLFPYRPYHPWDYAAWAKSNPPPALPARAQRAENDRRETVNALNWLLGDGPSYLPADVKMEPEVPGQANRSSAEAREEKCQFAGVTGSFFYPPNVPARPSNGSGAVQLPTIVWLPPFHCSTGYRPDYRTGDLPHRHFANSGFLVLAFDPIATGTRQDERRSFYDQYPHWSLMGKMVLDCRHALDAVLANPDADPKRIYLVGFGMGGMVAVFTAALDARTAGCAAVCGFTPFRTDTGDAGTGGLRRWSHLYGWLPRVGGFVGSETEVPVDFPELLSTIAPRAALVIAPTLDWHNSPAEVARAVDTARPAFAAKGASDQLQLYSPKALAEFNNSMQERVIRFFKEN
jgi:dienelactone hydrolase